MKKKIPAKNKLLTPVNEESKSIMEAKNDIIDKFAGKEPQKISEQYVNDKLKLSWKKPIDVLRRRI